MLLGIDDNVGIARFELYHISRFDSLAAVDGGEGGECVEEKVLGVPDGVEGEEVRGEQGGVGGESGVVLGGGGGAFGGEEGVVEGEDCGGGGGRRGLFEGVGEGCDGVVVDGRWLCLYWLLLQRMMIMMMR